MSVAVVTRMGEPAREDYAGMCRAVVEFFDLKRQPVAVRLLREPLAPDAPRKEYCGLVLDAATEGRRFVLTAENAGSPEVLTVLGLSAPKRDISPRLSEGTRAVVIEPLRDAIDEPHVVILIGSPAQVMDVVFALSWVRGGAMLPMSLKGAFALCGECTALPLLTGNANASLLCPGARLACAFREDEVAIGLPWDAFRELYRAVG